MTVLFSDAFNRADSTTIGSPDVGTSWTERNGDWEILSNKLNFKTSGLGDDFCHTNGLSATDYFVQAKVTFPGVMSNFHGIAARRSNSGGADSTCYLALSYNGTDIYLYRKDPGYTAITNASWSHSVSTEYTFKLAVSGTGATVTLVVTMDGVEKINTTDTSASRITVAGDAACKVNGGAVGTKFDDFVVDDGSAAATSLLTRRPAGPFFTIPR